MITHTRQILKDLPRFLHKHLGLGTILTLSFMGLVVLLSPIFVPRAEQATIPAYALFSDSTKVEGTTSIKEFSLVNGANPLAQTAANPQTDFAGFMVVEKGSSVDSPSVSGSVERRNGSVVYKVAKGDVLSTIARKFDVSADIIISANNLKKSGLIRLGQELLIPNPKLAQPKNVAEDSELLDVKKYLSMPVKDGLNLGQLHGNQVDILSACGTSIYASADGLVDEVGDSSEWNDGLGGYVIVKHQFNDVETIYAHNSKNLVEVGDLINAGDKIAEVGNTGGDTEGPTGCHLSFGVVGAKNPFVK